MKAKTINAVPKNNERSAVSWNLPSDPDVSVSEQDNYGSITERQIRSIRLEVPYALNQYFLDENHLLDNMLAIKELPTFLIHGRKDITCPVESSWKLHKLLTNSTLEILPHAGHLLGEPDMIESLVNATDRMIAEVS